MLCQFRRFMGPFRWCLGGVRIGLCRRWRLGLIRIFPGRLGRVCLSGGCAGFGGLSLEASCFGFCFCGFGAGGG